ncbi:hypothetical protein TRVL_02725 [Trypanosoma vivax]|nr:hypothetical protein TRVL_02725 [Trypanosoma vivax]
MISPCGAIFRSIVAVAEEPAPVDWTGRTSLNIRYELVCSGFLPDLKLRPRPAGTPGNSFYTIRVTSHFSSSEVVFERALRDISHSILAYGTGLHKAFGSLLTNLRLSSGNAFPTYTSTVESSTPTSTSVIKLLLKRESDNITTVLQRVARFTCAATVLQATRARKLIKLWT